MCLPDRLQVGQSFLLVLKLQIVVNRDGRLSQAGEYRSLSVGRVYRRLVLPTGPVRLVSTMALRRLSPSFASVQQELRIVVSLIAHPAAAWTDTKRRKSVRKLVEFSVSLAAQNFAASNGSRCRGEVAGSVRAPLEL